MRIFICHSNKDSKFVIQLASLLKSSCEEVFYYEEQQQANEDFQVTIDKAIERCDSLLVFVGEVFSKWQLNEVIQGAKKKDLMVCTVFIKQPDGQYPKLPAGMGAFTGLPQIFVDSTKSKDAMPTAWKIMQAFKMRLKPFDGLPNDPNLFSYEKDIIAFFTKMISAKIRAEYQQITAGHENYSKKSKEEEEEDREINRKLLSGCPQDWPEVVYWGEENKSKSSECDSYVVAAALSKYHNCYQEGCMVKNQLYFPEARSQKDFYYPVPGRDHTLRIAIMVAGGIAPGINAVIDGIVQSHWLNAKNEDYNGKNEYYKYYPLIYGITNGASSISMPLGEEAGFIPEEALVALTPNEKMLSKVNEEFKRRFTWEYTAIHDSKGGSIIGTSRVDELIKDKTLLAKVAKALLGYHIEILYVIGGDGSMKLAHALWHYANTNTDNSNIEKRLSVVAIPKTMDNDILWVWQSFGFLSAVEKAREILAILDTEIKSNPRLCILQLFGSDSGFVVSHTVSASGSDQCDAALIPEVKFSMRGLALYLQQRMIDRKKMSKSAIVPSGFVVMSETAIPTDAICYADKEDKIPADLRSDYAIIKERINNKKDSKEVNLHNIVAKINLSAEEKEAIYAFHRMRRMDKRIQGQTSDTLRSAGLKIVKGCLQELIVPSGEKNDTDPDWEKLRILTNEPRHILRSTAPACSDIIMGNRLGTLAAENAMAGYTDFMISQWLTEFVLVPLPLVVLGRKRIPLHGMFWKSVLAKTGQPAELDMIGELPKIEEQ